MIKITKQQIAHNNKGKMDILLKVILITFLSSFLVLFFFDYSNSEYQLEMNSPVNCLTINEQQPLTYLCNTCFKVTPQKQYKEKITFTSKNKFIVVGLKKNTRPMLECKQWLQTIDFQSQLSRQSAQRNLLKFQPFILRGLNVRQNQHNQILQILKSQTHQSDSLDQSKIQKAESNLQYPNYVTFYYTSVNGSKPITSTYSNQKNKKMMDHIFKIISISSFIAMLYYFHCSSSKKVCQNYFQNGVSFLCVLSLLVWLGTGKAQQYQAWFYLYCKVFFFSIAMGIVFAVGKWLFFGIIFLSYFLITEMFEGSQFSQIIFECVLMIILVLKVNSLSKNQYFFMSKQANKRIYFVIVSLIIVMISCAPYFIQSSQIKQIVKFQVQFICILSFLMSIKNMDDDEYTKLFKQQKIISPTLDYNQATGSSTSMVEQNQLTQKNYQKKSRK